MKTPSILLLALAAAACGERNEIASVEQPATAPAAVPPSPAAGAPPSYSATPAPGEELPPSQTTPGPIPLEFRHVWAIESADCTKAPGLTRIAIAPGAVKFYEGRSEVVSASAPHDGVVTLEVQHSSEGTTATETHALALDDSGKTLTYKRRGLDYTYTRCD